MSDVTFTYSDIPPFAKALKEAAPIHLLRATGKGLFKIGKSDIAKMKKDQLQGGSLNIKSKGFLNSFKFKASDSREAKSINDLQLEEYTGSKPFRIFQEGGTIVAGKARLLTILTDAARTAGGKRKWSQKELQDLIASGAARVIQTKAGPAIIKNDPTTTKSGRTRQGAKMTILAWLKPKVRNPSVSISLPITTTTIQSMKQYFHKLLMRR